MNSRWYQRLYHWPSLVGSDTSMLCSSIIMDNAVVDIVILMKTCAPKCCLRTVASLGESAGKDNFVPQTVSGDQKNGNILIRMRWRCGTCAHTVQSTSVCHGALLIQ